MIPNLFVHCVMKSLLFFKKRGSFSLKNDFVYSILSTILEEFAYDIGLKIFFKKHFYSSINVVLQLSLKGLCSKSLHGLGLEQFLFMRLCTQTFLFLFKFKTSPDFGSSHPWTSFFLESLP